ncbi:glycosyltransferase family 4 protein [Candidatus Nitrospira salsa]
MKMVIVNDMVYRYADNDPTAVGGSERYQWLLARALVSAGWCVTVGVHTELPYKESREIDGVKFIGIGNGNTLLAWYKFLRWERPDWWQWQCSSHWLGPAGIMAKLSRVRLIFSAMHDRDVQPRTALSRRSRWWMLYAWGLLWADRIFVQHQGQLAGLDPKLQSKAFLLPGIVQLIHRATGDHVNREPYVAWVGVLREVKRPDLLLEIAKQIPHIHFVVCGGPTAHRTSPGYCERIIRELGSLHNVEYLGHVPPEDALGVIAGASILLSTSDEEGFPSVFLEAWSFGTPTVSLNIDPDGIIQHKGLGTLAGNVNKAIADIEFLMKTPEVCKKMAIRAQQHVSEGHCETAAVRAFEHGLGSASR